jgi:hypothetical protein
MSVHPTTAPFLASIAPANSVHRFAETHCSQCGQPQGPGNSGFSSCKQHSSLPSFKATLGENIAIEVFYEYTPAEAAIYDVSSPVCGPGHDAEIEVIEVMLNGEDVRDLLSDGVIESLEQQAWQRVAA